MLHRFTKDELQQAVDGARIGVWSWQVDQDEVRWSLRVGEIFGLEQADYPGNIEAFSRLLAPSCDDLRVLIFESLEHETGRFELEHQIVRGDGSAGWVRSTGRMDFDAKNQPKQLIATAVDVTSQKEIELSLQTREEQFRRFSKLTSDYIYETDMTVLPLVPSIVAGSYERIVGYTKCELADAGGWIGIINSDDLAAGHAAWGQLKAGVPTVHEYRIVNTHGESRWLRDHAQPILKNGKLVRVIGGVKDITETKMLHEKLLQAQKHEAVARLAGAVAHDFNNLMCVVVASTELMSMAQCDGERGNLKADILFACDLGTELTRSLLTFSGNDQPVAQVLCLSTIIRKTHGLLQRATGEQIEVIVDCSPDVIDKVEIDPGHLQLVLLNLATNARKAMRNSGKLSISVSKIDRHSTELPEIHMDQCVVLEIADTGCGIAEEDLDRIFEPFFTTATDENGFGIGLATCRQIIEQAGGTIRVKGGLGQGATFSIYLPIVDKAASKAQSVSNQFTVGGKESILVVEDNLAVRRVSVRILQSHGYEVSSVDSIKAAYEELDGQAFDLLVVDMHLPDGNGCDLLSELKENNPSLRALLVSGHFDDELRTRVQTEGYDVCLKPYSATALARSVRTALQKSSS